MRNQNVNNNYDFVITTTQLFLGDFLLLAGRRIANNRLLRLLPVSWGSNNVCMPP